MLKWRASCLTVTRIDNLIDFKAEQSYIPPRSSQAGPRRFDAALCDQRPIQSLKGILT